MDALTAALVATLLAHAGDRTPLLAARLAGRYAGALAALVGLVSVLIAACIAAAFGADLVAPLLAPEAKTLLLGVALLWSGAAALGRLKAVTNPPPLGAFGSGFVSGGLLALAERAPFLVFAIAARSPLPWAAAIGGAVGALAVAVPAFAIGEAALGALPLRAVRLAGAALFLLAGAWVSLGALGLI